MILKVQPGVTSRLAPRHTPESRAGSSWEAVQGSSPTGTAAGVRLGFVVGVEFSLKRFFPPQHYKSGFKRLVQGLLICTFKSTGLMSVGKLSLQRYQEVNILL